MENLELDILYLIFNYYEINSSFRNGEIFMSLVDDFSKLINQPIYYPYYKNAANHEQGITIGYYLMRQLVFGQQYQCYFLDALKSKNYYMKTFIKDLIKELGSAKDKSRAEEIIDRYKRLPMINNVKFNGLDKYTIETTYGAYSFILADKVLQDEEIIEYMRAENRIKSCHNNATMLLNSSDDLYSICSLCHHYFVDSYYHSYGYIKSKDSIIDLCSNMLMEKTPFDDLYAPREILFMRNDELRKLYLDKIKNIQTKLDDKSILKCALYLQSLCLDDNPDEKKRVLEFNGITNLQ
ncbi:MAG: hypothetical protein J1F35_05310 [Erysipelotrichales bacterium]|nr:hypothetical protein [Erysipelotrichales bacterium]